MVRARIGARLGTGCLLLWSSTATSWAAAPAVSQILSFRPKQQGVIYSTPTAQEQESCKVELISGARNGNGWLLRDPRGQPLRRFFDTNGDKRIDVWSYYQDGVEVYREIDSDLNGRVDQYRWLNTGGMKWGVNTREDDKGTI